MRGERRLPRIQRPVPCRRARAYCRSTRIPAETVGRIVRYCWVLCVTVSCGIAVKLGSWLSTRGVPSRQAFGGDPQSEPGDAELIDEHRAAQAQLQPAAGGSADGSGGNLDAPLPLEPTTEL